MSNPAQRIKPFLPEGDPGPDQFVSLALGPLMHASGQWSALGALLGGGKLVLESGCGTGRWMAFFEKLGNRAVGVDDSRGPLKVAREHDPQMLRAVRVRHEESFL